MHVTRRFVERCVLVYFLNNYTVCVSSSNRASFRYIGGSFNYGRLGRSMEGNQQLFNGIVLCR